MLQVIEVTPAEADGTSHERWVRLEVIFHAAARLPPRRRASFLRLASEGDRLLAHEAEELLRANDAAHGRLHRIIVGAVAALGVALVLVGAIEAGCGVDARDGRVILGVPGREPSTGTTAIPRFARNDTWVATR